MNKNDKSKLMWLYSVYYDRYVYDFVILSKPAANLFSS